MSTSRKIQINRRIFLFQPSSVEDYEKTEKIECIGFYDLGLGKQLSQIMPAVARNRELANVLY
jgi:hypothetical protein